MGQNEAKTVQVEAQMSQFKAQMGQVEIQTGKLDAFKSRNIPKNQHFDACDATWHFSAPGLRSNSFEMRRK